MQIRDNLVGELEKADEEIRAIETELGGFDSAFHEVDQESESAAQCVRQANSKVEHARNEKAEIEEKLEKCMEERHELQVCYNLEFLNKIVGFLTIHTFSLCGRPSNAR